MGAAQGEGEGPSDIRREAQLVQLLAEELGAVRAHLLIKGHLEQLDRHRTLRAPDSPQPLPTLMLGLGATAADKT